MNTIVNMVAGQVYAGISEIEVFWVILAVFGLAFSVYNSKEAHKDVKKLDEVGIENGRRMIAVTQRFQDGCRALVHLIFLAIGLASWTLVDTPLENQPWNVVLITVLIRWGLITSAGILVAQSYASFHLRRSIIAQEKYALTHEEIRAEVEKAYIGKEEAARSLEAAAEEVRSTIE